MESLKIILNQYKQGNITEDQAILVITDIFNNNKNYPYVPYWPQITYTTDFPKYEITCNAKQE